MRAEFQVMSRWQDVLDTCGSLGFDGARPFDMVDIYTTQGVPATPIQRRDVLFDEQNTDPETGQLAKYRVSGAVETFTHSHQEIRAERVVGA